MQVGSRRRARLQATGRIAKSPLSRTKPARPLEITQKQPARGFESFVPSNPVDAWHGQLCELQRNHQKRKRISEPEEGLQIVPLIKRNLRRFCEMGKKAAADETSTKRGKGSYRKSRATLPGSHILVYSESNTKTTRTSKTFISSENRACRGREFVDVCGQRNPVADLRFTICVRYMIVEVGIFCI